jgi:hypothetical protein
MMQNPGSNGHAPAFAIVTLVPSRNRVAVCQRDLDFLLDEIDAGLLGDANEAEPAAIAFLPVRQG